MSAMNPLTRSAQIAKRRFNQPPFSELPKETPFGKAVVIHELERAVREQFVGEGFRRRLSEALITLYRADGCRIVRQVNQDKFKVIHLPLAGGGQND
jgi:hypothetical protein